MKYIVTAFAVLFVQALPLHAQVYEPREAKGISLGSNEGVLRLSLRTQRQFIETAYLYFIEVLPDGSDGKRTLQFERGAGVPIMGTNMIDVKAKYYRVPKGKYRLLAYTIACKGVPPPNANCSFYGQPLPTARYETGSPTFEVTEGTITDAGDFVIEYTKATDLDSTNLFDDRFADEGYEVRWRPIKAEISPKFATLVRQSVTQAPPHFQSRIECDQRPKDKTVQFPFRCSAATRPID